MFKNIFFLSIAKIEKNLATVYLSEYTQNPQNAQGFLGILVSLFFRNSGILGQNPQIAHLPTFTPNHFQNPQNAHKWAIFYEKLIAIHCSSYVWTNYFECLLAEREIFSMLL